MHIPISGNVVSSSTKTYAGFDKSQFIENMKDITNSYIFPEDYSHIVFFVYDKQCYYVYTSNFGNNTLTTIRSQILENVTAYKKDEFYEIINNSLYKKDNLYIFKIGPYSSTVIT